MLKNFNSVEDSRAYLGEDFFVAHGPVSAKSDKYRDVGGSNAGGLKVVNHGWQENVCRGFSSDVIDQDQGIAFSGRDVGK